jgi:tetratricopeptide (TPR) repeat protein
LVTQALTTAIRERERELELIGAALESVQRGHGRLLFFEGSPGIGKTRLLDEILEQARAADMDVLCARGGELEREFPFGLVRQLFEPRLASASEEERSMLLAGAARLCAPLVSHELSGETLGLRASPGAGRIGGQAAGDVPYATLHALYWLSANLATERPLLVAIDDAHWADAPSLRWASYLAGRLEGLPILVAVTTRSAEPRAEGELLATLASSPSAEVIYPGPLSEAAVAELVRETLIDAVDDYCRACHQVAAGNPFLLRELVAELASLGVAPTEAGVAQVHHLSPKSLSRSVLRRLARLPAEAETLARAVAVLGARAEPRHAAALCDFGAGLAAEAADHLAQADILHREAPFRFVHPIVRTAIYDDLPTSERFRSHLRAARILGADGASDDQVAAHLLATQPSDDRWVVDGLRKAAKGALEAGVPTAAVSYLRRGLTEPPPQDDMPELLTELGTAEARAGDPSAVEHLSQALELTGDARRRGAIALELGRALHMAGRVTETVSVLSRSSAELASIDDELALRIETELISAARMDRRTAPIVGERLSRLGGEVTGRAPAERVLLANPRFRGGD